MSKYLGALLIVGALALSAIDTSPKQQDLVQQVFRAYPALIAEACDKYVAKAKAGEIKSDKDEQAFFAEAGLDAYNTAAAGFVQADVDAYADGWTLEKSIEHRTRMAESARSAW